MEESLPAKLGKYVITRMLGKGAMGIVYEGMDPDIKRKVAIKTVHRALLDGEGGQELLARFKREAQSAGRLMHQNIVTIYEYGEEQGMPFIAMEFIQGKELKELIDKKERLKLPVILDIMTQTLSAMVYVHAAGVIHRDMKPANIILLEGGHVKLADFGIARVEGSTLTRLGAMMGTPSYMAPEQCRGEQVDKRSDLFSVGVILYNLLTGEKPFPGKSISAIMQKILYEPAVPPTTHNPALPQAFNAVIEKALAKPADDRFQSAKDFLEAIKLAAEDKYAPSLSGTDQNTNDEDATLVFGKNEQRNERDEATLVAGKNERKKEENDATLVAGTREQGHETFLTLLETVYEFASNTDYALSASARTKLMAKAKALKIDEAQAAALEQEVAARFAATGQQVKTQENQAALTGHITVQSQPVGALIWLDGAVTGYKTDANMKIEPGRRLIKITLDGYLPIEKELQVAPGDTLSENFVLAKNNGKLCLKSVPPKAHIWINGKQTGRQTDIVLGIRVGNHTVTLKKEGYQDLSRRVQVEFNGYHEENFQLVNSPAQPGGATGSQNPTLSASTNQTTDSEAAGSETILGSSETPVADQPTKRVGSLAVANVPSDSARKRSGVPTGPAQWLKDNGDGTVTDTRNGLISLKNITGFEECTWEEAMQAAIGLAPTKENGLTDGSVAGDWRLPTKDELAVLLDWKKSGIFIGVQANYYSREEVSQPASAWKSLFSKPIVTSFYREPSYWSNTTTSAASAWTVNLFNGKISLQAKVTYLNAWPVRRKK